MFPNAASAHELVGGVPLAARAVRLAAGAGYQQLTLACPAPWQSDGILQAEVARLGNGAKVTVAALPQALADGGADAAVFAGQAMILAEAEGRPIAPVDSADAESAAHDLGQQAMDRARRLLVNATAKPGDGIVSRHLNRPISQAISLRLLRLAWIRPVHGTWGTALIAVAMIIALLQGTPTGLVIGALLFQAASIFDGVDGEIARASFRTSASGAALDSLIDAATNLACVGGVAINLYIQGQHQAAMAGGIGLLLLAFGLSVIGLRSRGRREGLTFNAVKEHFDGKRSHLMQWLTWITMRDFYALAGAILISCGFSAFALYAFAVIAAGWLMVVLFVMMRQST